MSTMITTLPNSPGLSVTAYVQGGPAALGPQQETQVGLLAVTYPTGSAINPAMTSETFLPATLPAPPVVYQITVPNTAGSYDLTVPFKCKVIAVSGIATDGAAGDTVQIKKIDIATTTTTVISDAISLNLAAHAVFSASTIDNSGTPPNNELQAGDKLLAVAVKGGSDCSCDVFITVVPVA